VVVDFILVCQADEHCYQSNQTRSDRDQSWYHVLVDGKSGILYIP
jgi:heat shock protein HspQ